MEEVDTDGVHMTRCPPGSASSVCSSRFCIIGDQLFSRILRRHPQEEKGGEDEMKRGGRGRRRAHGEVPPQADLAVGGKKATPPLHLVRSARYTTIFLLHLHVWN